MRATRSAFRTSNVLIYANFMPGESLPEDDKGYLKGIYRLADSLGFGVGGPDLLPNRRYQRKHSLPLIAARAKGTLAGLAVQDGNLADLNPAPASGSPLRSWPPTRATPCTSTTFSGGQRSRIGAKRWFHT